VDTLKIDRSFIDGLGHDAQDTAIVRSVVTLAQTLELRVTAEGVETPGQQAQLRLLGCDYGQGYQFGRPVPAEAARAHYMERIAGALAA
jgi:EAL domain-containing protein (putative c-di-GMP-specific phosphodiesterase class I)